jgi:hypothetical protein
MRQGYAGMLWSKQCYYFDADIWIEEHGAGLGASHQTGWTGLVTLLIQAMGHLDSARFLEVGRRADFPDTP